MMLIESVFIKLYKDLEGSFALGIIFKNFKDTVVVGARRGSPLSCWIWS